MGQSSDGRAAEGVYNGKIGVSSTMHSDPAWLYLDLLKKSVLGELYSENEVRILYLKSCLAGQESFDQGVFLDVRRKRGALYEEYMRLRETGINYGRTIGNLGFQHTMIGRRRLENIEFCLSEVLAKNVPGDCMECGVWRGGAVIFMRGYLAAYQVKLIFYTMPAEVVHFQ